MIYKIISSGIIAIIHLPIQFYHDKVVFLIICAIYIWGVWQLFFRQKAYLWNVWLVIKNIIWDLTYSFNILRIIIRQVYRTWIDSNIEKLIIKYIKSGIVNWFRTSKEFRIILLSSPELENRIILINSYFKSLMKNNEFYPYIEDYKILKNNIENYRLYWPKWFPYSTLDQKIEKDMLHSLNLDINEYSLSFSFWTKIVIEIKKNTGNQEPLKFSSILPLINKDEYIYWIDSEDWNLVKKKLWFTSNNSLGCYGKSWVGKTSFLSAGIISLYQANNSESIRYLFYINSWKSDFEFIKNLKWVTYSCNLDWIIRTANKAHQEIERRNNIFAKTCSRNLDDYLDKNPANPDDLQPIYFIIDELSYIIKKMSLQYEDKNVLNKYIKLLSIISITWRSVSLFCHFSTQKPSSEILGTTEYKDQLQPISFRSWSSLGASMTIFWKNLDTDMLDIGEMIMYSDEKRKYIKVRTPYVSDDDISKFLQSQTHNIIEEPKSNIDEYIEFARKKGVLNYKDSALFWISERKYLSLSATLQEAQIIKKLSWNILEFNSDATIESIKKAIL